MKLTLLGNCCKQCASPLSLSTYCGQCLSQPPHYDRTRIFFSYTSPLSTLLCQFKFKQQLYLTQILSKLFLNHLTISLYPECLIPTPLHPKRLFNRGFNQAFELSRYYSQILSLPIKHKEIIRHRNTRAQSSLTTKERKKNLISAFSCQKPMKEKFVAIIDDIMTTGETANALAKCLKQHGVERVELWCIAKTVRN